MGFRVARHWSAVYGSWVPIGAKAGLLGTFASVHADSELHGERGASAKTAAAEAPAAVQHATGRVDLVGADIREGRQLRPTEAAGDPMRRAYA